MAFIFGGSTGISSPKELEERRDLIRAIAARNAARVPQDPWEGMTAPNSNITMNRSKPGAGENGPRNACSSRFIVTP